MKRIIALAATVMALSTGANAQQIDIQFSKHLQKHLDSIARVEQRKEEAFRRTGLPERNPVRSVFRFNDARTAGTQWAGEQLIPQVENYDLPTLLRRLIEDNLLRADVGFDGTIRLEVDKFRITNADVAALRGVNTYAKGRISLISPDGDVLESHKVRTNFVTDPTVDPSYTGDKYAFLETDPVNRIGPLASQFVEKALERAFPEHREDIHGPVIVSLITGASTQVFVPGRF
ncbi:MAG: hypothetical protein ACFB22_03675 [Rhodothalassiaceae bacterium]